jgi:hypothetical protein
VVQQVLKLAGDSQIHFQQIGELTNEERHALGLRQAGHLGKTLFPVGVRKGLRGGGGWVGKVIKRL